MHNNISEKVAEITGEKWKRIPIKKFNRNIKSFERKLKLDAYKSLSTERGEWRLVQKEIRTLITRDSVIYINVTQNGLPVIGELLCEISAEEISFDRVCEQIATAARIKYISSMDVDTLTWQVKYSLIYRYINKKDKASEITARLAKYSDFNNTELTAALNPLEKLYAEDKVYNEMDGDSKNLYRRMTAEIAIASGRDEIKVAKEFFIRSNNHIGEEIFSDYRKMFPFIKAVGYAIALLISASIPAISIGIWFNWWDGIITFLPLLSAVKPIVDLSVIKTVRIASPSPAMRLSGEIPDGAKTLCCISTLLFRENDAADGLLKLKAVKAKNDTKNLTYCLLCDLPSADSPIMPNDNDLLDAAKNVFSNENNFVILVRERVYSETQRVWQGDERKRGAILALARLLRSNAHNNDKKRDVFRAVYGDLSALDEIKFILALDYDSLPLMDSISELVGIALHPLSEGKGIIAPRMTTALSSYLKTGFSRAMTGNGGTAGASTYDSLAGEMYQDCFGEGTFTGKGLINVDILLERCDKPEDQKKNFPRERILSHDILEGGHMGVIYAGNVEFSDSFPESSSAYFKRQHRWLRGDLQNFPQIFNKNLSSLTRLKLIDNIRRAISPVLSLILLVLGIIAEKKILFWLAVISVLAPYLMCFFPSLVRGRRFSNYRRFYAPVLSQTAQLIRQCILELMLLPKNALISIDSLIRTLWRTLISKRRMLEWTASNMFYNKKGHLNMAGAEILSFCILYLSAAKLDISGLIVSAFFICALPILEFIDRADGENPPVITERMKTELMAQARQMWSFYSDFVTPGSNFLPPDNVQYSPVYRICSRTSPTNIGMYLLSALSAFYLGIIEREELSRRICDTISTIEKLSKWRGNLFNWFDTDSLEPVSGFVSSVDSGNFLCCLMTVKEGLKSGDFDNALISRLEETINAADLKCFFNEGKQLFSLGYDVKSESLSLHHYDLIMSEARMMSYYAIGCGMAGKRHWRSLGRTMGRQNRYAAPIAWTGTMFEYFMPELLLKSKMGSMEYEALRFALYCQKKRALEAGVPFGMSESAYYAFDNDLNYQYKAHGVGAVGLKEGLNRECVVSPYSSYLAMQLDPVGAYNNLKRLESYGTRHPKYGFYEAADFTPRRVGTGCAVIKSHMSHHVGMSMAAVVNTLQDGVLREMFFRDPRMKRAEELLEEKIIAGETVLGEPERQREDENPMNTEEIKEFSIYAPHVTALSNGVLTLFCADIGTQETLYKGLNNVRHTDDLKNPRGMVFAFIEQEYIMPFFYHPAFSNEVRAAGQSVSFRQNTVEYSRSFRNLKCNMLTFLHPSKPVEIRRFSAQNTSGIKRQMTLTAYLEPTLARIADTSAHPAFMDLFLSVSFDEENQLFIVSRRDRHSDRQIFMAAGCTKMEDISYSFDRESVIIRNQGVFSTFKRALTRENNATDLPAPCLFLKIDFPVDAHGKKETEIFFTYGESRQEVINLAHNHRFEEVVPNDELVAPPVYDTIYGRLIRKILPHMLYAPDVDKAAIMSNQKDKKALWKHGISGDFPIVAFLFKNRAGYIDGAIQMKKALMICQVQFDLVIICESKDEVSLTRKLAAEIDAPVHIIMSWETDEQTLNLIKAASVYQINSNDFLYSKPDNIELKFPTVHKCSKPFGTKPENRFNEKGDVFFINKTPKIPWCNLLAAEQFGCLVSDCALGFSWALNSRENKLTPWNNDIMSDNQGEMLLIKTGGEIYDIINGSSCEFSPNKADYHAEVKQISAHTRIRAFEKGMGKEITVVLSNNSKALKTLRLAFYLEPVLGTDRKNAQLIQPLQEKRALIFKTPGNGVFSGALTVSADRDCLLTTNRREFWSGDWEKQGFKIEPAYDICGAVIVKLDLPPKYTDKVSFILAFTKNKQNPLTMQKALLKQKFAGSFIAGDIKTTDTNLAKLYKYWLPWQIIGGRMWARTGYYQNSGAFGFRDQLQDALAVIKLKPEIVKKQIINAAGSQFPEGDVLHWWHSMMNTRKGVRTRYSDDLLWLPYVLAEYIDKTGDDMILKTQIYYCDGEMLAHGETEKYLSVVVSKIKDSLYAHSKNAIEKAYQKGRHDLLLMGCGDWCDGFNNVGAKGRGESVWLSMFYIMVCEKFMPICDIVHDEIYKSKLERRVQELKEAIDTNAWDGEYYLRAFYDDGSPMGSRNSDLCKIDLLPQAFGVFAGLNDEGRKLKAISSAIENLVDHDNRLVKLFAPPFAIEKTGQKPGYVMDYPEGVRENGGQYTHAAAWLALACKEIGMRSAATKIAEMISPINRGKEYKTEPYYMAADIYTNHKAYGRGGWSIYTGSAGWYFRLLSELYEEQ
ncbi:MAG: hypothetical protein LBR74_10505 [Eubacterium sp.]|nr:hypothetical protein [Eubacterium sp.]